MSTLLLVDRRDRVWLRISWPRVIAWGSILLPVVAAVAVLLLAADPAWWPGVAIGWWPAIAVGMLALVAAMIPDSSAPTLVLVGYVAWWVVAVPASAVGWAWAAALCLLAFHGAVALAASGPPGCEVSGAVRRGWARRLLGVGMATGVVAAVALLAAGLPTAPLALVAVALSLLAALPYLAGGMRTPD